MEKTKHVHGKINFYREFHKVSMCQHFTRDKSTPTHASVKISAIISSNKFTIVFTNHEHMQKLFGLLPVK